MALSGRAETEATPPLPAGDGAGLVQRDPVAHAELMRPVTAGGAVWLPVRPEPFEPHVDGGM
eukprot:3812595-Prymnesium_polylepis.1